MADNKPAHGVPLQEGYVGKPSTTAVERAQAGKNEKPCVPTKVVLPPPPPPKKK